MYRESEKTKILIVDDETDMRIFLSTLVETAGFVPVVAENGMEGIEKASTETPDLIILDVMMPKEDGVQMYLKLKKNEKLKPIPVIMLSVIDKKTFFQYLKVYGGSQSFEERKPEAYVEKPPETDELLDLIQNLTGSTIGERPSGDSGHPDG